MAMRRISLKEYPQFLTYLKVGLRDAAESGLYSAALRLSQHIVTEVIPSITPQPVDRGIYKAGWGPTSITKIKGQGVSIFNRVPHAAFIEEGVKNVREGRRMIQAITEWAKRHGMVSAMRVDANGKLSKNTSPQAIAFAIIANMKKRGGIFDSGRGFHIFQKASERLPKFIQEEVARSIKKALG